MSRFTPPEVARFFRPARAASFPAVALAGGLAFALALPITPAQANGEINIYSYRQPFLLKPLLDAYEDKTGTKANVVYAAKGLAQRLEAEGEQSPADVVLTVDISRLSVLADKDLFAPISSAEIEKNVPAQFRHPEGKWTALSLRARVIAISKKAGDADKLKHDEDLATPAWKGRLCTRPGSHVYNRALLASVIAAHGVEEATAWAKGVVGNLARKPQGHDRAQAKAIMEGQCDVAIMNSYYMGKMMTSDKAEQKDWANAVNLIFPNQGDRGTHVNISGGGIVKTSKNKDEATRLLAFLTSPEAQRIYAETNFEYPVNPAVKPSETVKSWGAFTKDKLSIEKIAELSPTAQKVIDQTGW
ncbi:MAG: Fe(3+) ABC transporter substrate-binding protein [Pseudomonadota bacterium]